MINQGQQNLQAPPQQPVQYPPPQKNRNSLHPFFKIVILIGTLTVVAILIPIALYMVSNVKKEKPVKVISTSPKNIPSKENVSNPAYRSAAAVVTPAKNVSVLFANNVRELFDHKFDTLRSFSSITWVISVDNISKKEVNIGYSDDDIVNKKEKYEFYTTKRGKYVVRKSESSIEIAPSNNITAFNTIVSCSCTIHSFIFSSDESKIAYVEDTDLYVSDLEGSKIKLHLQLPQNQSMLFTPLIAFNAEDMKLALGKYRGMYGGDNSPLPPQIISFSIDGMVENIASSSGSWDFLSQFSNDLSYVYGTASEKKNDSWYNFIQKYNSQTNKKEELFLIPEHNSAINLTISPLGNKLAFFLKDIKANTNKLYVININDNSVVIKNINDSIGNPSSDGSKHSYSYGSRWSYFWSPDERYIYLEAFFGKDGNEGNSYLFDTETQELKLHYKSKGYSEAFNDLDPNSLRQIESADFIGWLAE